MTDDERAAFDHKRFEDGQKVLVLLTTISHQYPHLRIGQILDDALFYLDSEKSTDSLFYVENDVLLQYLLDFKQALYNKEEKGY